jgi:hypothetical protein
LLPDDTNGAPDWYLLDLASAEEVAQDPVRHSIGRLRLAMSSRVNRQPR